MYLFIYFFLLLRRLLRNAAKPLTSEHPSEYGELYSGAAGAPKHWLLGTCNGTVATPRYRTQPVGPGPSQVKCEENPKIQTEQI